MYLSLFFLCSLKITLLIFLSFELQDVIRMYIIDVLNYAYCILLRHFIIVHQLTTFLCFVFCFFLLVTVFQNLDEVQSYIIVERSVKRSSVALDSFVQEFLHVVSSFILSSLE